MFCTRISTSFDIIFTVVSLPCLLCTENTIVLNLSLSYDLSSFVIAETISIALNLIFVVVWKITGLGDFMSIDMGK